MDKTSALYQEAYEDGLNDAWETARKIITWPNRELVNSAEFDLDPGENIFTKYSASEAIKKLRDFEDRKYGLHIGDEVTTKWYDRCGVIIERRHKSMVGILMNDGVIRWVNETDLKKTGNHYEEVATLLKMLDPPF